MIMPLAVFDCCVTNFGNYSHLVFVPRYANLLNCYSLEYERDPH
jgi:hypothetical protein